MFIIISGEVAEWFKATVSNTVWAKVLAGSNPVLSAKFQNYDMNSLNKIKNLIEKNPAALATVTSGNKPNIIGVAFVKVVSDNKIVITDNYMNQTLRDILKNRNVCLIFWDSLMQGYKLVGQANYFTRGKWFEYVKVMKENSNLPAKGAILIKVTKIIKSK